MQSDGGLTPMDQFCGSRAVLSGPAGGVVGYAVTSYHQMEKEPVIGFDMGGESRKIPESSFMISLLHAPVPWNVKNKVI